MDPTTAARAGRKRASSREMLEEAASESFIENTYAGTTIEDIARRAGVSRNTFFNYFDSKSDVLWSSVDGAIDALADDLADQPGELPALIAVRDGLIAAAFRFGPGQLPLAITQFEVIGMPAEFSASGLTRFLRMASAVEAFLAARCTDAVRSNTGVIAYALVAAIAAAGRIWAAEGIARRPLGEYVAAAITPICAGYASALDGGEQ
jgi:AcrR family transcriptional regulator